MKTLHLSIIVACVFVTSLFVGAKAFGIDEATIPHANLNMTYKISSNYGVIDWNPTSNILVVTDNDTLTQFAENGTKLAPLFKANFGMDFPRFNHDGTKIAFLSNDPASNTADIYVLDLGTRQLSQLTHVSHVFYYAWTPDDNIIYSTIADARFKIYALDVKNNSTSQIMNSYNLHGLDASPDGKKLVISQNYTSNNCSRSYYAQCYDHLFIYDLGSTEKSFTEIAQTDSYKFNPRWSHDGSFIIYTSGNDCGTMEAITPDGKTDTSLIHSWEINMGCYSDPVINADNTIIAYEKGYGGIPYLYKINPLNGGLYLTYTNLCANSCKPPVSSLPILDPIQTSRDIYLGPGKIFTTYDDHGDSTEQKQTFGLDNKTLSFVLENQGKPRYLKVFFPTSGLKGNITVLIDGKEFYPKLPDECTSLTGSLFSKCQGAAGVENFGEWTMVKAADNDVLHNTSTIEIIGTNTIPEFPFAIPVLLIVIALLIIFTKSKFRQTVKE